MTGALQIQKYGDGGFRLNGERHEGSLLILPDRLLPWAAATIADLTLDQLDPLFDPAAGIEVLLIGCGPAGLILPRALRERADARRIGMDAMSTGSAARTYNLLTAEGRRVAAALIAV